MSFLSILWSIIYSVLYSTAEDVLDYTVRTALIAFIIIGSIFALKQKAASARDADDQR